MSAGDSERSFPFSEEEMSRAMRLAFSEEEAEELASRWAAVPEQIERGELTGWTLAEGTYLLLSLLGGETAIRVEREYLSGLDSKARKRFEQQRDVLRRELMDDGRL